MNEIINSNIEGNEYEETEIHPINIKCVMAVEDNEFAEIGYCFQFLKEGNKVIFYDDLSRFTLKQLNVIPFDQFKREFTEVSRDDYNKYVNAVCEGEDRVIDALVRKYVE